MKHFLLQFLFAIGLSLIFGCASKKVMQYEKIDKLQANLEYEKMVKVKTAVPAPTPTETKTTAVSPAPEEKDSGKKAKTKTKTPKPTGKAAVKQPDLEDKEGFIGRRPQVDPFRVGEKVTLAVTYMNMAAGWLTLETRPFVEVNGRKAYHFNISLKSSKMFSYFYAVDDSAETYVDYETMVPYTMGVHVRETKQIKEMKMFFDWHKRQANYWESKVPESGIEETKKLVWNIPDFSQNVISAIFYMRTFVLTNEKKLAFRVADDGKNMVFKGQVLRREEIKTNAGPIKTVVLKPEVEIDGVFKPMGEVFLWLTDDDRKLLVRLESKIKIGTIVAKLESIE